MGMTREKIQDEIRRITQTVKIKEEVAKEMEKFLKKNKCSEFDTKQIMNDLTSYKEFLELGK